MAMKKNEIFILTFRKDWFALYDMLIGSHDGSRDFIITEKPTRFNLFMFKLFSQLGWKLRYKARISKDDTKKE